VAVIGAGIVGAACAYELAQAGLRVVVVEPNAVGSGATNLGYGSLCILDQMPGQLALTRYGLSLWDRLVEYLPPECEYSRCGTIWLALDEEQLDEATLKAEFLTRQGVTAELLDEKQIAEAEPGLTGEVAGGIFVEGDGWLRASRAADFLLQLAISKGAKHIAQRAISIQNHEVKLEDGSTLFAGNALNAAGSDASPLTPDLPLKYSKGHILMVENRTRCVHHHLSAFASEIPADTDGRVRLVVYQNEASGQIWIGSSSQPLSAPSNAMLLDSKIVGHMLRRAIEMVPAIGQAKPLRSWAGLRVSTADSLPLIGPAPRQEGVLIATAHNAFGATASLASARLLVDELLCQTPEIDPTPYRADRFEGTRSKNAR
jgi:glycine/D-amino acid oxidase-like deaminating enzyme